MLIWIHQPADFDGLERRLFKVESIQIFNSLSSICPLWTASWKWIPRNISGERRTLRLMISSAYGRRRSFPCRAESIYPSDKSNNGGRNKRRINSAINAAKA